MVGRSQLAGLRVISLVLCTGSVLAQPADEELRRIPRLVESLKDFEFAPDTPYSWVSLEALNDGEVDSTVIPDAEMARLVAGGDGRAAIQRDCYEFRYTDADPSPDAVPRESWLDYLNNPHGVISATVVEEMPGFYYGDPVRFFALEIHWFTGIARQFATDPILLLVAPDVTMAFGDTVVCHRFPGTDVEILSIGSAVLYFPADEPRPEGIEVVYDLVHVAVDLEGEVVGAQPLVGLLDLRAMASTFEEVETLVRRRMGPALVPAR